MYAAVDRAYMQLVTVPAHFVALCIAFSAMSTIDGAVHSERYAETGCLELPRFFRCQLVWV